MRLSEILICIALLLSYPSASHCLATNEVPHGTSTPVQSGNKRLPLPPEDDGQDTKSTLNPGPLMEPTFPNFSSPSEIIRLEASYNQGVSLRDALLYTLRNNLPIKISRESWHYQRYQLLSQVAGFIPTFSTGYNVTGSSIQPDINSRATVYTAEVDFPVFQGGSVFYNSLAQLYRDRGWKRSYDVSVSDALLETYNKYSDLLLQNALLRIRAKALRLSEYALQLNTDLYNAGLGTQFNVMQTRTQVGFDRTAFIEQESVTRQAALSLAYTLNLPLSANLIPIDSVLQEATLINPALSVSDLVNIAFNRRPDLRQYELFRLAAARTVQASAAGLYPQVSFFIDYTHAETTTDQPSSSSGSSSSASSSSKSSSTSSSSSSSSTSSSLNSAGIFPGNTKTLQTGFNLTWTLSNMGLLNAANIMSARALSRQAMLQANQALQSADQDVRTGYINYTTAKQRISDAASAVAAAKSALKFAHVRLRSGVGTNLETIEAQKDYINALSAQANAITSSNQAQAFLLHASGLISLQNLTDGFKGGKELPKAGHSK